MCAQALAGSSAWSMAPRSSTATTDTTACTTRFSMPSRTSKWAASFPLPFSLSPFAPHEHRAPLPPCALPLPLARAACGAYTRHCYAQVHTLGPAAAAAAFVGEGGRGKRAMAAAQDPLLTLAVALL